MTREAQRRAAAGALGDRHLCRGLRAVDFWELGGSSGWNKCGSGGTGAEGAARALASSQALDAWRMHNSGLPSNASLGFSGAL